VCNYFVSSLVSFQLLVYLLPSDGNRYRLSPQYLKTTIFIFYAQFQQTINKYNRINYNIVRSVLLIQRSRDKTYIGKGTNENPILYNRMYSHVHNFSVSRLPHVCAYILISYYVICWINSEIIITVVDGNLQNLHGVSAALQEFHAFGECKLRHAVTLNCCALIKIKHAQRRATIRK